MPDPSGAPRASAQRSGPVVEILRWPVDAGQRGDLLERGRPCLWLLDEGELAPELERLEDWARLPVDERDLHARIQRLAARAGGRAGLLPGEVEVDDDGLLTMGTCRVVVPLIEATILNRLGATPGRVVGRDELVKLVWNDDRRSDRAIDSRVHTLRGRIAPLGLTIHTIRGHGFLLAVEPEPTNEPAAKRAAP